MDNANSFTICVSLKGVLYAINMLYGRTYFESSKSFSAYKPDEHLDELRIRIDSLVILPAERDAGFAV
jgi:hypothetical protein